MGYAIPPAAGSAPLSESDRLELVPLVFGLLPTKAVRRHRADELVKPYIRSHLVSIGLEPTHTLVDILKSVADQYAETSNVNVFDTNVPVKRKMQISGLRALGFPYTRQIQRQHGRCAVCGALFDGRREEQLDHIIPFRLIGDVRDGSNWQILCFECNNGKGSLLTTLLSPDAWGWVYATQSASLHETPSLPTRYVVLAQRGRCEQADCNAGPTNASLDVVKVFSSGLAVADNLRVACELHR